MAQHSETEETRIDRWLCAVRLVKTRPMATQLCEGGHVRVNGKPAKPSTKVRPGDEVHAVIAARERIVEVVRPIETRVGAPAAAECYVDKSPPPVVREIAPGVKVLRGEGRSRKRLRRELIGCGGSRTADAFRRELNLLQATRQSIDRRGHGELSRVTAIIGSKRARRRCQLLRNRCHGR